MIGGFTPINRGAFVELIEKLPPRHRLAGRSICLDLLFHARRKTGTVSGVMLNRGQVLYSERGVSARASVPYQTTRTVLSALERVGFLTREPTQHHTVASIHEFGRYVNDGIGDSAATNAPLTHDQRTTNAVPNGNEKRERDHLHLQPPSPQEDPKEYVAFCMARFLNAGELPRRVWAWIGRAAADGRLPALVDACQKQYLAGWAVSDLDQVRPGKEIDAVIGYLNRMVDNAPKSREQAPQFNIANALGEPITDREERLRLILDRGLTADPDPGHQWSIPDDVVTKAES